MINTKLEGKLQDLSLTIEFSVIPTTLIGEVLTWSGNEILRWG